MHLQRINRFGFRLPTACEINGNIATDFYVYDIKPVSIDNDGIVRFFPFREVVKFNIKGVNQIDEYVYNLQGKFPAEYAWLYIAENVPIEYSISVSSIFKKNDIVHIAWTDL